MNGFSLKKKIVSALDLPKEILLPVVTVTGGNEIMIVNYKGLMEYSNEKLRLNTSSGVVVIEGKNLTLSSIRTEKVMISGNVTKIELEQ